MPHNHLRTSIWYYEASLGIRSFSSDFHWSFFTETSHLTFNSSSGCVQMMLENIAEEGAGQNVDFSVFSVK